MIKTNDIIKVDLEELEKYNNIYYSGNIYILVKYGKVYLFSHYLHDGKHMFYFQTFDNVLAMRPIEGEYNCLEAHILENYHIYRITDQNALFKYINFLNILEDGRLK